MDSTRKIWLFVLCITAICSVYCYADFPCKWCSWNTSCDYGFNYCDSGAETYGTPLGGSSYHCKSSHSGYDVCHESVWGSCLKVYDCDTHEHVGYTSKNGCVMSGPGCEGC